MSSPAVSGRTRPNERRIRAWLARVGEASRTELARQLELPKATVAGIVTDLIERGVVAEVPRSPRPAGAAGAPGRPAQVLTLTGPPPAIAALTWSTGMLRVAIATLSGQVLAENTAAVESDSAQQAVAELAAGSLETAISTAGYDAAPLAAVVLSAPAPVRHVAGTPIAGPETGKRWGRGPAWLDEGLARELARRTGSTALVENDANLGALGEYAFGAGRGKPHQIYLKLGRHSVGTGLIFGGRLHRGATGFAGELAHVQVRDNGPVCTCGGRGCLIQMVSTEMIGLAQPAYEQPLTFATMLSLAEAGDIGLQRLLVDLGRSIGRPLADACTLLNPDLFVLDGSIGPAGDHIFNGITEAIERYATPATSAAARVVRGVLGTNAEVLGAVVLVRQAWERAEGTFSGPAAPR
ncbi:MAG TPA: ROK family protein [Streptosporangiaceae bacterium]|jgi:predicted NBD/HSP70 family sugar kinase|nr:ROK family protein [Streptosporangiaceae bacterium]